MVSQRSTIITCCNLENEVWNIIHLCKIKFGDEFHSKMYRYPYKYLFIVHALAWRIYFIIAVMQYNSQPHREFTEFSAKYREWEVFESRAKIRTVQRHESHPVSLRPSRLHSQALRLSFQYSGSSDREKTRSHTPYTPTVTAIIPSYDITWSNPFPSRAHRLSVVRCASPSRLSRVPPFTLYS